MQIPGSKLGVTDEICETGRIMFCSCQAVVFLLMVLTAVAQSQAFITVTVKHARSPDPRNQRVHVLPNGDLIANAVPVITLLSYAYDVPINPSPRLSSLPDWAVREKYDIEAKAPANAILSTLQYSEVRTQIQQMIRGLLADRFKLVMRVESKKMSVFALTIDSGGPKLQRAILPEKDCIFDTRPEGCHTFVGGFGHPLNARAIDMDDLAHYLENWSDLPVVNRTALNGLFTVRTEGWVPMRLPPPPPNTTPAANPFVGLPTIFAVLEKLGLGLKRQEDVLPIYTVERIQRPAAN